MASWMGKSTLEPAQPGSGAELGNKKFLSHIGQFIFQRFAIPTSKTVYSYQAIPVA